MTDPHAHAEHLTQIAAIWGADRVGDALDVAIEAGKSGITAADIAPMLRERAFLRMLDMSVDGQSFYTWTRAHDLVSEETWEAARRANLLATRPEHPCPTANPVDGKPCIRNLHHPGQHLDGEGWSW